MRQRQTQKNKKTKSSWGYHLIVNAGNCDAEALRCGKTITAFAKDLVKKINMVAYGEPKVIRFGSEHTQGYTLVQLIETSCISAHFVEETNDIYLDIFSCKMFNQKAAMACFRSYFKPDRVEVKFMERQAPRH